MPENAFCDVLILGAGISGLTAAYTLHQAGFSVRVIEKGMDVGGAIQSFEEKGYLTEGGPNTFQSSGEAIMRLCGNLRLSPQAAAPQAKKRYLYRVGPSPSNQLYPLPTSPIAAIQTPLLSWRGKYRLLMEPFIPALRKTDVLQSDETVADFIRRRLGEEVLRQLMGPFLSGIYAGDPEYLSLSAVFPKLNQWEQEHGSLLKGGLAAYRQTKSRSQDTGGPSRKKSYQLYNFQSGMQTLPRALAAAMPEDAIRLGVEVRTILIDSLESQKRYKILLSTGETMESKALLLALPAGQCAHYLQEIAPQAQKALLEIPYAPIAIVHLGFKRENIPHPLDGFGCLIPRNTGIETLGCLWISSLFPGRAPENHVLLTCYIGGATHPDIVGISSAELVRQVCRDIARIFNMTHTPEPSYTRVIRHLQAIPQYTLGHLDRVGRIEQAIQAYPGFAITGNYLHGVSINDCIHSAEGVSQTLFPYLRAF